MSKKENWVWMPHAGHLIVGDQCQFHMSTYVGGGYLVSTVGEWWPDRLVRGIHAEIYNKQWYDANKHLKGDTFDRAYMKEFGFEDIGASSKYETMVFKATNKHGGCEACPWVQVNGRDLETARYDTAKEAYLGHLKLCNKWAAKERVK